MAFRPSRPSAPPGELPPQPSLMLQTLLTMARQREGLSEPRCRAVLGFIEAGGAVDARLRAALARDGLTRTKFAILVALFAIDPMPASPSDLALHIGAGRPSVSAAITGLARRRLVVSERSSPDRRISYVHLTVAGREITDRAAMHCLQLADHLALRLAPDAQAALLRGCAALQEGALTRTPA